MTSTQLTSSSAFRGQPDDLLSDHNGSLQDRLEDLPPHLGLSETVSRLGKVLVSVDVFDTLLLRGTEPDLTRHRRFAKLAARRLAEAGCADLDWRAIVQSRQQSTRAACSLALLFSGREDVPARTILGLVSNGLGLADEGTDILLQADYDIDLLHVRLNQPLALYLRQLRAEGYRVVLSSDTNYESDRLRALLHDKGATGAFDGIRTSADYGATKHSGSLFVQLMAEEGKTARQIVHVGDDPRTDWQTPRRLGIHTVHVERPLLHRILRRLRKAVATRLPQ
jgi:FMN phosphatase YigB (HAD superfamily)